MRFGAYKRAEEDSLEMRQYDSTEEREGDGSVEIRDGHVMT
jgi:hypothetical protein